MDTQTVILVVLSVLVLLCVYYCLNKESYTSKREKASVIQEWFSGAEDKSYANYKNQVKDSDIIDFTAVKSLPQKTVDAIEKILQ